MHRVQRRLVEFGMSRGLYHLCPANLTVASDHHPDPQLPRQMLRRRVYAIAVILDPPGPVIDVARLGGLLGGLAPLPRLLAGEVGR